MKSEPVTRLYTIYSGGLLFLLIAIAAVTAADPTLPKTAIPAKIESVLQSRTFFYSVMDTIYCNLQLHDRFMENLPLSAKIANCLKDRHYEIIQDDSVFVATDHDGLTGEFTVAYANQDRRIYYGEGTYHRKWLLNVKGRAIVDIVATAVDSGHTARQMALYLKIDSGTIGFLAKAASKVPLLNSLVRKFAINKALSFAKISADITYELNYNRVKALAIVQKRLDIGDYQKLMEILTAL